MGKGVYLAFIARTVIQEKRAAVSCDGYRKAYAWFPKSYRSLEWLLAQSCHKLWGSVVIDAKKGIFTYTQGAIGNCFPVRVVYQCKADQVTIYDIKVVTP